MALANPIQGGKTANAIADKKTAPFSKDVLGVAIATLAQATPVSVSVSASAMGSKGFSIVIQG